MNKTCQECLERCLPEDPRQPFYVRGEHRYLKPICYDCPDYDAEEIHPLPEPRLPEFTRKHVAKLYDKLEQTDSKMIWFENKINELRVAKKDGF